ncbi:CPS_collapsed_G0026510.mRNA.1.CDS.1 [Saccharomyces cerevisiae]|nr:CPS_collapsed_G0026510.mRNA.1.CDS.1 [Saccharomyces cerevisiae]
MVLFICLLQPSVVTSHSPVQSLQLKLSKSLQVVKLTLLDGDKYVFSADFKIHGGVFVEKSKATYPGTEFDISGENFDVTGNFNAEESAATSASIYSFTPSSFDNSGDISLSLSKSKKGEVTFSPYSNSGAFSFSNAILNGGSVSGLQRRDDTEGSVNNGEINLDNGSTYVIVEPVSGKGTVNIISGNLYLHYPDTFTGQTVVFKGEGVLAVDPTETNATPIPVVGYTGENQIAITADVTALSYDSATGVLTATQGNSQFSFSIGTGFSSSGFNVSEGTFAGAYAYYLNYGGVVASSATPSSTSTTSGATNSTSGSTSFGASVTGSTASTSFGASVTGSTASTSFGASVTGSTASTLTSGSPSVYTTTLTYATTTSTVVVSCSETTDSNGNVYTITTTVPCSSTTATITSCDETGCHVTTSTGTVATETVSSKSYTTVTVTHCDNNGCNTKTKLQQLLLLQNHTLLLPLLTVTTTAVTLRLSPLRPLKPQPLLFLQKTYTTATVTQCNDNGCSTKTVTSEAPKETSATTTSPKSYTTVTVTHCDDNGCNTKTVTSEAPEATTTTVSPKTYTTATVTQCDDNGCSTKTVTSEAPKETSATTTSPKSYTTVTVTHCDDNGCNTKTVTSEAPEATTTTVSPKTYTTATVTQCDDNGCSTKTVTSEAPKETSETSETSAAPKTYTTATVTQCDDNGCNVKIITSQIPEATSTVTATSASPKSYTTVTSEGPKATSLTTAISKASSAISTYSKSAAPIKTSTGIIVQSEGIAAGLNANTLNALVGIFVLAFFN